MSPIRRQSLYLNPILIIHLLIGHLGKTSMKVPPQNTKVLLQNIATFFQKSCFQPQTGWAILSYTPGWVLLGPVTGRAFRAHLAISPLYNSHVWVMSMSSSGRPVKNKCAEIIFNVVLFIICANLQYPKLFPLELCFYQFCNKPQCNSFNFYLY